MLKFAALYKKIKRNALSIHTEYVSRQMHATHPQSPTYVRHHILGLINHNSLDGLSGSLFAEVISLVSFLLEGP